MPDQILVGPQVTSPAAVSIDFMVDEVAGIVGGKDDPQVRSKAISCLNRAADRMNASGIYLYRRKTVEYDQNGSGDLDLTNQDTTLTLPSDWGWPEGPYAFAKDTNGDVTGQIAWVPWETYKEHAIRQVSGSEGIPSVISIQNEMEDLAYVWPPIQVGDDMVDRLEVYYFARILRPGEVSDSNLYATEETVDALITGGEAFMVRYRQRNKTLVWKAFMEDFEKAIDKAKGAAHRNQQAFGVWAHPGESGYEHQGYSTTNRYRTYIVI